MCQLHSWGVGALAWRKGRGKGQKDRLQQRLTELWNVGKLSVTRCPRGTAVETSCETLFSLQVGVEAEGSGLGWGSDIGSGSGDQGCGEELLKVSVKADMAWRLDGLHTDTR